MKKYIPDGTRLSGGLVVFNPEWWRLDRWLFWFWLCVFSRRRRGLATFTYLAKDDADNGPEVLKGALPVYEET